MKNICVNTAYALVPYIIGQVINIILSNCLLRTESAFITFVSYVTILWTVVLLISGMKTVHQYSIPKTLLFMLITILAMVVILVLLVSLFQQVYVFIYSIYTELLYRFSNLEPTALIFIFIGVIAAVIAIIVAAYTAFEKHQIAKERKKLKS